MYCYIIKRTLAWLLLYGISLSAAAMPPQRIVSLTPHITEQLFAIGAGQQVVGRDEASDWPAEAKALPVVANYQSLNIERLLALKPDLVILWNAYQQRIQEQIRALGIPMLVMDSSHLQDLPRDLRLLGTHTGHVAEAETLASDMTGQLAALASTYQTRRPVRVFYQLWYTPMVTVAKGSWIHEAIEICGGQNLFADSPQPYPQINLEHVLIKQPEIIIATQGEESLALWQRWTQLPAVAHQQLKLSKPDRLQRLTPRTPAGIRELCELIDGARQATR